MPHKIPLPRTPPPSSNRDPRGVLAALTMDVQHDPTCALYRAGSAEPLKAGEKKDLLEALRGGEHIELEFEAVTFIQRSTPNRNFVRFPPGKLPGFAKSYEGQPFLKNHDSYDVAARGGTILSSKLEHNDDGSKQMRMRVLAVKPWAVEGLLDGTIDRFSIGWDRNGMAYECSIHLADWYSCSCRLGAKLEDGRVVELLIPNPTGTEMSGVNVPAVIGTSIESISQLGIDSSRLADSLVRDSTHGGNQAMDAAQLALLVATLGLAANASPAEILAAAGKACDDRDEAIEQREELKAARAAEALAAAEKLKTDRKVLAKQKLDALKAAGKLKPGSAREDRLKLRAERDFDDFIESCDELLANGDPVTPVTAPLPAAGADPAGATHASNAKGFLTANPVAASWLSKAGISEAEFEKHGKNGVEFVEAMQNAR